MNYLLLLTGAKHRMAANSSEPYNRDIRLLKATSNQPTVDIMFMPIPRKNKPGAPVKLTESASGRWHPTRWLTLMWILLICATACAHRLTSCHFELN